jgi:hypothetical protein
MYPMSMQGACVVVYSMCLIWLYSNKLDSNITLMSHSFTHSDLPHPGMAFYEISQM